MRIDGLQAEMQAMMLEAGNTQAAPTGHKVGADFGDMLSRAINNVNGLQKTSGDLQMRFDRGDEGVSLSDVMIARNKSSVAFEATIQVRNKLVEAYKELMNMPV
ncbi:MULTISPECIES: flagellar hook-basal body complex protein FliE [Vibrio]|uniref:Flagellar hook-basal body complex protein FliE n=1 Tax=Vibrio proteolyticus NBRC 13287 TaxID=1219065 RepID=U3BI71_VIBPR|nr:MULTISPECIES: flagellar hook-basal body complex protein FliE [Vibrio]NAW59383.1 flagellar hook-basal body complex protein FliE [Vibrio sp. V36_P2S2PM302]NAX22679.1 flagellar hook-basal body complex protein FliE [Vibrio sp. V39_P1S14PM300]NAX24926.1 flagellar hook-basal body complex protein FliE [Vibrio sp. V38_P2S17PM301]NAX29679.1 flagellar hook-basal body complex protein FliE [Vibrio sp. V37_P2S8PM304]GAD66363.1 flagellar hook-basal body complex protein FliE [Vibrio proteolyticus NBRC 132